MIRQTSGIASEKMKRRETARMSMMIFAALVFACIAIGQCVQIIKKQRADEAVNGFLSSINIPPRNSVDVIKNRRYDYDRQGIFPRRNPAEKATTTTIVQRSIPKKLKRNVTETGIDVSDPSLYGGFDQAGDSTTSTVMGIAVGYNMRVYERFVGTLRKSGYAGNIILGISPQDAASTRLLDYFQYRNVTAKILQWVKCNTTTTTTTTTTTSPSSSTATDKDDDGRTSAAEAEAEAFVTTPRTCVHPYPDMKLRWSRYPLQRDWLEDCATCTGSILIADVRDTYFQRDPFGYGSPVITGLQVFQEHATQTTDHWLTRWPIRACKGVVFHPPQPMLCSGTTVGTRRAMMRYLDIMHAEMKLWIADSEKCNFDIHGDDQSVHNYLYYTDQLPFAVAIANRAGGIVNTVGKEGAEISKRHTRTVMERYKISKSKALSIPYEGGTTNKRWIGTQYNLTDDEGWFTEADGSSRSSRVIHQFDRFGKPLDAWMDHAQRKGWFHDPIIISPQRRTRDGL